MVGLLSRPSRRQPRRRPYRPALRLQWLESRDCPAAPVLGMSIRVIDGGHVEVSGYVRDDDPASAVVHFGGAGQGEARPAADGSYLAVLPATVGGAVTGWAVDGDGLTSNQSTVLLMGGTGQLPPDSLGDGGMGESGGGAGGEGGLPGEDAAEGNYPPLIWISFSYGPNRTVIIDGTVVDEDPGGLTVVFSGMVNGSAVTNADGTFHSVQTQLGEGHCYGLTWDREGYESNVGYGWLGNAAPQIDGFGAVDEYGSWVFHGTVYDEYAPGLQVRFESSIPQINGRTAVVAEDGTFTLVVNLPENTSGLVCAVATDWWGLDSEGAYTMIG
jgi:hypothetical protein